MMPNKLRRAALILGLFFLPLACWPSMSFARNEQAINGVGFASMEKFSFDSRVWNYNFSTLAKESYWMKYSSFKQVAQKLQMKNLRPFSLKLPHRGTPIMPTNTNAVHEFHEKFNSQGDEFLQNIALANNAILLVFDYVEKYAVERFINNQTDNFVVHILVYYLDSNAIGLNHIPISRNEFSETDMDYNELESKIHGAILEAIEEAVVSTRGLVANGNGPQPVNENDSASNSGQTTGDSSGTQVSDVMENSHISEQERSSFWE